MINLEQAKRFIFTGTPGANENAGMDEDTWELRNVKSLSKHKAKAKPKNKAKISVKNKSKQISRNKILSETESTDDGIKRIEETYGIKGPIEDLEYKGGLATSQDIQKDFAITVNEPK